MDDHSRKPLNCLQPESTCPQPRSACPRVSRACPKREADCGLDAIDVGCGATVVGVIGDALLRRRLLEMGFCSGTCVRVIRRAPFGDPIELCVRGYHLSLREAQARCVRVAVA